MCEHYSSSMQLEKVPSREQELVVDTFSYLSFQQLQVCSGRGFSKNQQQERIREMHGSLRACRGADAIVFNLFACEGWFIAKYFDVPCVAASPFAVTRFVV